MILGILISCRRLATAGAIDRAATIHLAVDAVPAHANAGFNADAARAHADTGSDADTGCARTSARNDAHTARAPALSRLPNTALRRAICVTVNRGLSRRRNQR
jgi:hypothetical protein